MSSKQTRRAYAYHVTNSNHVIYRLPSVICNALKITNAYASLLFTSVYGCSRYVRVSFHLPRCTRSFWGVSATVVTDHANVLSGAISFGGYRSFLPVCFVHANNTLIPRTYTSEVRTVTHSNVYVYGFECGLRHTQ